MREFEKLLPRNVQFNRVPDFNPNLPRKVRWHGSWFDENGQPRGGGGSTVTESFIRWVPHPVSHAEVCETLGLTEDGHRLPYKELHPAVKPVKMRRTTIFDALGRTVKKDELPVDD